MLSVRKKVVRMRNMRNKKIVSAPFLCVHIFFREIFFLWTFYCPCVKIFLIVQKSFYAAGFRGPVHIDTALCGQAGWIWIILQSRYYHPASVVDPGCLSRFRIFSIPDPDPGVPKRYRILDLDTQHRIENGIYVLLTQRLLLSSGISDPGFFSSRIRYPGSGGQKTLDPGYESVTLHPTVLLKIFSADWCFASLCH